MHAAKLVELSTDLPVVIEIVDGEDPALPRVSGRLRGLNSDNALAGSRRVRAERGKRFGALV